MSGSTIKSNQSVTSLSCYKNALTNANPRREINAEEAKQPEPEIEVEDDLVIDDNDLDLIDRGDR